MKKIIIITIIIALVAIIGTTIFIFHSKNNANEKEPYDFNFEITENPYGFQWGMSIDEVEDKIKEIGLTKVKNINTTIVCNGYDFQNISGLNVKVFFLFDKDKELTDIMYSFDFTNTSFDFTSSEFSEAYKKELSNVFGKEIKHPEQKENATYWLGDKTFITALNSSENKISFTFTDITSQPALVDDLKLLK